MTILRRRFHLALDRSPGVSNPLSRRRFLGGFAALPVAAGALRAPWLHAEESGPAADPASTPAVRFSPTAFLVNGKPRFLAAGTMDYFRCPAEQWRDRILKARRAGLNTIMTYVAWNVHEPVEGEFRFTGMADIAGFLRICADLEMLAIVRMGPFTCDEWEAAGYPAWLIGKEGTEFRIRSEKTDPYLRRWFQKLCAQVGPLQASRGGPVVLVQAENEYYARPKPGAAEYMEFLRSTLRECGIDVPLTECGSGDEVQAPGYLETINGYGIGGNERFRREHPGWPLLISEHYTQWLDCWGWAPVDAPKRAALEQSSMDALSRQIMLSYFCFHGGTSFGFNASSSSSTDHSWVTPSYYTQSPVMEGGGLSDRYFAVKSASLPVAQFEEFFCKAKEVPAPLRLRGPVRARALRSEQGSLVFVQPMYPIEWNIEYRGDGDNTVQSLRETRPSPTVEAEAGVMELPDGKRVPLAAGSVRGLMLPYRFAVDERNRIDYANATLLGVGGSALRRVLVFWGEAGRTGVVAVNGEAKEFVFPGLEPLALSVGDATVLALSSEMADRTWFAEGRVVVGPAWVGEFANGKHECWIDQATRWVLTVSPEGKIDRTEASAAPVAAAVVPLAWSRARLAEPADQGAAGWQKLEKPLNLERLGPEAFYGYQWYRAVATAKEAATSGLLFTAASDRFHVWAEGKYLGVCGRGAGEARDLFPLRLAAGRNRLTFLCDNMGRLSEGGAHQYKGIFGPVYAGARRAPLREMGTAPASAAARDDWQFKMYRSVYPNGRFYEASWKVPNEAGRGLFLALRKMQQYAWVFVNGELIGEHHGDWPLVDGFQSSEHAVPAGKPGEESDIRLRIYGGGAVDLNACVTVYSYPLDGALTDWAFRAWRNPDPASAGSTAAAQAGEPCWWQARVGKPALPDPLFMGTEGLSKGQVYLNGEPMGRYWSIGPQRALYLPGFRDDNTLALLDEEGKSPEQTSIFRGERVPVTRILV